MMSDVHDMSILTSKESNKIGRNVPLSVNHRGEKVWFTQLYEYLVLAKLTIYYLSSFFNNEKVLVRDPGLSVV